MGRLLFCALLGTAFSFLGNERAFAQRLLQSSMVRHMQVLFERADTDEDGRLSESELNQLFDSDDMARSVRNHEEVRAIVDQRFGNQEEGIELVDLLHAVAIQEQRVEEAARESARQIYALQEQVSQRMHAAAEQPAPENNAQQEVATAADEEMAELAEDATEAESAPEVATEIESPHAEYFRHFDINSDGRIAGEEWENVPKALRIALSRNRDESADADVSLADFHRAIEDEKSRMLQRQTSQADTKRYIDYLQEVVSAAQAKGNIPEEVAFEDVEEVEESTKQTNGRGEASVDVGPSPSAAADVAPDYAGDAIPGKQPLTVSVVVVSRVSIGPPAGMLVDQLRRALSEDTFQQQKSLAGRIIQWGDGRVDKVTVADAFEIRTLVGKQVTLQSGGEAPWGIPKNVPNTAMISAPYKFQTVGTMLQLHSVPLTDTQVALTLKLEKSLVTSLDIRPATLAIPPSTSRRSNRYGTGDALNPYGYGDPREPESERAKVQSKPVDIRKLATDGTVIVSPGKPTIFNEILRESNNAYREFVVLIEVRHEND